MELTMSLAHLLGATATKIDPANLDEKITGILAETPALNKFIRENAALPWRTACAFEIIDGEGERTITHEFVHFKCVIGDDRWCLTLHSKQKKDSALLSLYLLPIPANFHLDEFSLFVYAVLELLSSLSHLSYVHLEKHIQDNAWHITSLCFSNGTHSCVPHKFHRAILALTA